MMVYKKLGKIGLGRMGANLIERLLKVGGRVVDHARRQKNVNNFVEKKAEETDQFMIRDGRKWKNP